MLQCSCYNATMLQYYNVYSSFYHRIPYLSYLVQFSQNLKSTATQVFLARALKNGLNKESWATSSSHSTKRKPSSARWPTRRPKNTPWSCTTRTTKSLFSKIHTWTSRPLISLLVIVIQKSVTIFDFECGRKGIRNRMNMTVLFKNRFQLFTCQHCSFWPFFWKT